MLSLIPWYVRWGALAVLAVALVGFGYVKGLEHGEAFKAEVAAAAGAQQAKNAVVEKQGAAISAKSGIDYAKGSTDLRALYGPGRVRHANSGSSAPATVPNAPTQSDASPADPGPSAGVTTAPSDQCAGLRSDASVTTLQLLLLQDWADQQEKLWKVVQDGTAR